MAELFNIQHETDLSEYDSTTTDGGKLSQGTPGLAGTVGRMEALIDDRTAKYGTKNQGSPASDELRLRFYIDPNGITIPSGEEILLLAPAADAGTASMCRVWLTYDGSNYLLTWDWYDDNGVVDSGALQITDTEHYIECHVERATGEAENDGRCRAWIDGNLEDTETAIDNWDNFDILTRFRLGATWVGDIGISGTFYLDEFAANDDGSEIGAVVVATGYATII